MDTSHWGKTKKLTEKLQEIERKNVNSEQDKTDKSWLWLFFPKLWRSTIRTIHTLCYKIYFVLITLIIIAYAHIETIQNNPSHWNINIWSWVTFWDSCEANEAMCALFESCCWLLYALITVIDHKWYFNQFKRDFKK